MSKLRSLATLAFLLLAGAALLPGCKSTGDEDKYDETRNWSAERLYNEAKAEPGLRARWLVRSTSDANTFFTISSWNSLADLENYERSDAVRRQILRHIVPHLSGASIAHHCEVRRDVPLTAAALAAMFESLNDR